MAVKPLAISLGLSLGLSLGVSLGFLGGAAIAYEVTLRPGSLQLGDTLSVDIRAEQPSSTEPPQVRVGNKTYPSFALPGPGLPQFRALIPTSPLDKPSRLVVQVSGQERTRNLAVELRGRSFRTQSIWLPPGDDDLGTDFEFDRVDVFKQLVSPARHWSGPLLRPSAGSITTEYGVQRYYNGKFADDYYHRGVDYAAPTGTTVVAPAAGYVRLVGREAEGFEIHGNTIGVDHGQGVLSIMIHLSRIDVQEGDFVTAGQRLGAIGNTGASTGPHLHWGLYVHGVAVDPVPWRTTGVE